MKDLGIPKTALKRVVIAGGGFGGLKLARELSTSRYQVVLMDQNNYHNFQPLLYQVATGGLEPDSIAYPLRKILGSSVFFRLQSVTAILPDENMIQTPAGTLFYDYLVLATGSRPNFYGIESIEKNAFTLKSVTDALDIRSWLFQNLEQAVFEKNESGPLSIAVAGGGPTGVEVAGALADLKNHVLSRDYRELNFHLARIYLIEAAGRLLGTMSENASTHAYSYLQKMGVEILLNQSVKTYDGQELQLSGGQRIRTKIFLWTAGVMGNPVPGLKEASLLKNRRYTVDEFNRVSGYQNIFAIGDAASANPPAPMLAPVAIQQAKQLASNLNRQEGKAWKPFRYRDKGVLATIGRNKAITEIKSLKMYGFIAWLIWIFVHLMSLVGFRNRVIVFTNWVINYIRYDSAIRLIIRPVNKNSSGRQG